MPESKKAKILIIDDEQINLEFFNVMLSRLGFEVFTAASGDEGLEIIEDNLPDLIILDIIMPGISGWEVIETLKEGELASQCRDIPIIMFSAMDDSEEKIKGYEKGIEDYITKPFNFSEVFARIRAVIKQRELVKQNIAQEKHLERTEILRDSLSYFTEHLKKPVDDLLAAARTVDLNDPVAIEAFRDNVITECEQTLATIGGLADKVAEFEKDSSYQLKDPKTLLKELDQQYLIHYNTLKESE